MCQGLMDSHLKNIPVKLVCGSKEADGKAWYPSLILYWKQKQDVGGFTEENLLGLSMGCHQRSSESALCCKDFSGLRG